MLQSNAQAQTELSDNLSKAERIKKIMHENYESSHTTPIDSVQNAAINGQQTIQDQHGKVIKQGDFRDGILRDWFLYKYSSTGNLLEKHIYKNWRFLTKETP